MIDVQTKVIKQELVELALKAVNGRIRGSLEEAAWRAAEAVQEWIVIEMDKAKNGVQWPNLPYRSSAPLEVPRSQFGDLAASVQVSEGKSTLMVGRAELSAGGKWAPYAAELEFGSAKVLPRPFLRPGVDRNKSRIANEMGVAITEAINR